jgi:hypothetical protein
MESLFFARLPKHKRLGAVGEGACAAQSMCMFKKQLEKLTTSSLFYFFIKKNKKRKIWTFLNPLSKFLPQHVKKRDFLQSVRFSRTLTPFLKNFIKPPYFFCFLKSQPLFVEN